MCQLEDATPQILLIVILVFVLIFGRQEIIVLIAFIEVILYETAVGQTRREARRTMKLHKVVEESCWHKVEMLSFV